MQQVILDRLAALEQTSWVQSTDVGPEEKQRDRESRAATRQCFQALVLTQLFLLESRTPVEGARMAEVAAGAAGAVACRGMVSPMSRRSL